MLLWLANMGNAGSGVIEVAPTPPTVPGIEYTLSESFLYYSVSSAVVDYTLPDNVLDFSFRHEIDISPHCLYWASGYGDPDYVARDC